MRRTKPRAMLELTTDQISTHCDQIDRYVEAANAADGSVVDPNANVDHKTIATMKAEVHKSEDIQINRRLIQEELVTVFGDDQGRRLAKQYIRDIEDHIIYVHDESALVTPYTYSKDELVNVEYRGRSLFCSFSHVYSLCEEAETIVDVDNDVLIKLPIDMRIQDRTGWTPVTRLVKKRRHRDLVRVKTAFGEDIVVTDNHPMIISMDHTNTVDASDSEGAEQLRVGNRLVFKGSQFIDMSAVSPYRTESFEKHYLSKGGESSPYEVFPSQVEASEKLGYLVGFFIGDGNYRMSANGDYSDTLSFTQKDRKVLERLADISYELFGAVGYFTFKNDKNNCWCLTVRSRDLVYMFRNVFHIEHYSEHKNLPVNILEYTETFALGVLGGILDSDGTIHNDGGSIRLVSREAILQIMALLHHFGFSWGSTTQSTSFGDNTSFKTNHTIWGVGFDKTDKTPDFGLSFKYGGMKIPKTGPKYSVGWSAITSVSVVEPGSFLDTNDYIYDITTESSTFVCNGLWVHNCAAISLTPLLEHGTKSLGGHSGPPTHLSSYMGQLVNTIFTVSSQVAGAVGVPGALIHMDAFARKDFGDNYMETNLKDIKQALEFFLYTINEPAGARGHQCFDTETDILTPDGFKRWDELSVGQPVYVWKDGALGVQPVQAVNTYDYSGIMHSYVGRDVDMLVTPNHRVLHHKNNSRDTQIHESHELFNKLTPLSIPVAMREINTPEFDISDDMLTLITRVLCEGTFVKQDGKHTQVRLFKSDNRGGSMELTDLLSRLEMGYTVSERVGGFAGCSPVRQVSLDYGASEVVGQLLGFSKAELPPLFQNLSQRQAELVIDTWAALDGFTNEDRYGAQKLQCDNTKIQDQVQHLCFLAGLGSRKYSRLIGDNEGDTLYVTPYIRKAKYANEKTEVQYTGKVWCPTTEAGVVVVRRNGKIFISGNSAFTNISIFDEEYFDALFGVAYYPMMPDIKPDWESYKKLQEYALDLIRDENRRAVLTFPVKTATILHDGKAEKDPGFVDMLADDLSKGSQMFMYLSTSIDSLSSCCRLRSSLVEDGKEFMHSLGAGGVATGSLNVITLNINRITQDHKNLKSVVDRVIKYQVAHRKLFERFRDKGMYPLYDAGYLSMDKQFLTIGVNGIVEAAESLGMPIVPGGEYQVFVEDVLGLLNDCTKQAKRDYGFKMNVEAVPAENLGVRNAKWDKEDGYRVPRDCYNSYFFPMEDPKLSIIDKFRLHGAGIVDKCDGGQALHLNLDELPSKEGYKALIRLAIRTGCEYFTTNVLRTVCEDCSHIEFSRKDCCVKCGSKNISHATRIIGYLKKIPSFSSARQKESGFRIYHDVKDVEWLCDKKDPEGSGIDSTCK